MTDRHSVPFLWYSHCGYSPLAVAVQLGWLRSELAQDNIGLKSVKKDGTPQDRQSHYDHHLANSIRQGGSVPAIWAKARGAKTSLIGLNWLDEYQAVVTLPGTSIHSAKDLRGARLGLPSGRHAVDHMRAANLRGFTVALESAGLDPRKDVEFVLLQDGASGLEQGRSAEEGGENGGNSKAADALLRGTVDAIFARGPHGIELVDRLHAKTVLEISAHPDPLVRANNGAPRPLTVDTALLEARPDIVRRILTQVAAVGPWAEKNPGEAAAFIAHQGGVSLDAVARAYKGNLSKQLHINLNPTALAGIGAFKDFLVKTEFLEKDFDIQAWADHRPLADLGRAEPALVA